MGIIGSKDKPALWRFLFCSSVPVFVFYLVLSGRSKAQPNWIAPAAPALFLLATLWWHRQWSRQSKAPRRWLIAGITFGLPVVATMHEPRLFEKGFGISLSQKVQPLNRVRGGSDMAAIVAEQRALLAREGRVVFIIADHYRRASLLNFYLPEARLLLPEKQLVYVLSTDKPQNQYWFWPGYENRTGGNAIFVMNSSDECKAPKRLRTEFEEVESLGVFKVRHQGKACNTTIC